MALKSKRNDRGGKSRGSGFTYKERSSEDVRKRAEQQGGRFDSILKAGFDAWRPGDGENVIRILPPTWEGHDHYGYDVWLHSYVGPDKSTYLCPNKMLNKPCPICKAARDAQQAGEEEDAKGLQATRRVAVWVLDRDADRPTPALWTMSWSMDRDIATLCQNKRTGKVLLIDNPYEGYDITFKRTGKGLNTRYVGLAVDREVTPALDDEEELDTALEYVKENPIPDVLNFYDEAYLTKVIEGTSDDSSDDDLDDDDDAPRGKTKKSPASRIKSTRHADEDDDDEEEDEAPRAKVDRGKTKKRHPVRDEDDDADDDDADDDVEDDDEDDDDDAPRGKNNRGGKRSASHDDDDDDVEDDDEDDDVEDDDDEDDDDDAPRGKTKSAARRSGPKPGRESSGRKTRR